MSATAGLPNLELILDINDPAAVESCRRNVWNVYRIIPDSNVVLVCRTFLQTTQLLSLLSTPLVRLVVDHLHWTTDVFNRRTTDLRS